MMNKTCFVCGLTKDIAEFYKNPHIKDGHEGRCKECRKAYQVQYRLDNLQENRRRAHEYYASHKEQTSQRYKIWRKENLEHKTAYDIEYKHNHPEQMIARRKVENARRRARLINAGGSFTPREWLQLKEKYGNKCLKCGKTESEVKITPDHVVPLALGGSNTIGNIQPLCWGCNAAKQARIADYRND